MKYVIYDVETTISNKGNPFDLTNKLVAGGLLYGGDKQAIIDYDYSTNWDRIRTLDSIFESYMIVGFNLKFDLNWARRLGCRYPTQIWDCQLAKFLMSNQEHKYPSLDETLAEYGYPPKYDVVEKEYWDKDIDTDQIPREILTKYLETDLIRTEQVFKYQYHLFQTEQYKHLYRLFRLQCQDLLTLADMEYNGVFFNTKKARDKSNELLQEQEEVHEAIRQFFDNAPISLTSDLHLSSVLYGGVILDETKIPIGVYKTGAKAGQVKYKNTFIPYKFPRLVEPLKGTEVRDKVSAKELELIKEGILTEPRKYWSVNEDTLKQVKAKKEAAKVIDLILRYNKIHKLRSTYLEGWSNLIDKMNWEEDTIHSQLNQTLAVTGRLTSSKPNGQNADKLTKLFCESRYA